MKESHKRDLVKFTAGNVLQIKLLQIGDVVVTAATFSFILNERGRLYQDGRHVAVRFLLFLGGVCVLGLIVC